MTRRGVVHTLDVFLAAVIIVTTLLFASQMPRERDYVEETGLAVEIVSRCAVLDRITRDNWDRVQYHYVLVDFACRPLEGSLQPGSDITEARWVPLEELENLEPMTRGTARVILDAAGDLQAQNISF